MLYLLPIVVVLFVKLKMNIAAALPAQMIAYLNVKRANKLSKKTRTADFDVRILWAAS